MQGRGGGKGTGEVLRSAWLQLASCQLTASFGFARGPVWRRCVMLCAVAIRKITMFSAIASSISTACFYFTAGYISSSEIWDRRSSSSSGGGW